jgi:uncharacterized membrane protein YvlD (DUF360 family)
MIRMLVSLAIHLVANAIGLLVAAAILDDMTIDGSAFLIAIVIFTAVEVIVQPLIQKMALTSAPALMGGTALVATLIGLIVTSWISDGLSITGFTTWVLATLIVWLAALLAGFLLPVILVKLGVESAREKRAA